MYKKISCIITSFIFVIGTVLSIPFRSDAAYTAIMQNYLYEQCFTSTDGHKTTSSIYNFNGSTFESNITISNGCYLMYIIHYKGGSTSPYLLDVNLSISGGSATVINDTTLSTAYTVDNMDFGYATRAYNNDYDTTKYSPVYNRTKSGDIWDLRFAIEPTSNNNYLTICFYCNPGTYNIKLNSIKLTDTTSSIVEALNNLSSSNNGVVQAIDNQTDMLQNQTASDKAVTDAFNQSTSNQVGQIGDLTTSANDYNKPKPNEIISDANAYISDTDVSAYTNILSVITGNNTVLIMMLTLFGVALVAYVLFGKRG